MTGAELPAAFYAIGAGLLVTCGILAYVAEAWLVRRAPPNRRLAVKVGAVLAAAASLAWGIVRLTTPPWSYEATGGNVGVWFLAFGVAALPASLAALALLRDRRDRTRSA